jgi:hypothetical protein
MSEDKNLNNRYFEDFDNYIDVEKEQVTINDVVNDIISINDSLRLFWTNSKGWAPDEAFKLLIQSRLDWQVSLSWCLKLWLEESNPNNETGRLILAWANLGSLVEGTMKLFMSIYYMDYLEDSNSIRKREVIQKPDQLTFEDIRQFYTKSIWGTNNEIWSKWVLNIQQRRNAIHAFKDRDIGTFEDFFGEVRKYLDFLKDIDNRLPYP